jgi:hypothetical protein
MASISNDQIQKVADRIVKNQDVIFMSYLENARLLLGKYQRHTIFVKKVRKTSEILYFVFILSYAVKLLNFAKFFYPSN